MRCGDNNPLQLFDYKSSMGIAVLMIFGVLVSFVGVNKFWSHESLEIGI